MRTRPGTRKASCVPPYAYCRALLIGPDPGGMKYKNRNKAPLPVPGEMLRYRIRDSASAPSRACKQTQNAPPRRPAARYYRRSLLVCLFSPPSTIECRPPRDESRAAGRYLRGQEHCELSAIFPPGWKFRDYRRKRRKVLVYFIR